MSLACLRTRRTGVERPDTSEDSGARRADSE